MTIYVDFVTHYPNCRWSNKYWSHIACDQDDLTELHDLIDRIGIKRIYFQEHRTLPHYDLYPSKRKLAIKCGAIPVTSQELVNHCSLLFRKKTNV